MKQWKVSVWPSNKPRTETVVSATGHFEAKRVAAAMFQCKESRLQFKEKLSSTKTELLRVRFFLLKKVVKTTHNSVQAT